MWWLISALPTHTTKACKDCGEDKPLEAFGRKGDKLHYYCRICMADRTRRWRQANPEKRRAQKKRWAEKRTPEYRRAERERHLEKRRTANREYERANKDKARERHRRWREANAEWVSEYRRQWFAENPGKLTEYSRRYRYGNPDARRTTALRKPSARDEFAAEYAAVLLLDPCSYCGHPADTIDHITSLHAGGLNEWSNYTAACRACNGAKRERSLLTFLPR